MRLYLRLKPILDPAVAVLLLPAILPLLALIALAIRVDSPGPVFFRQRRLGLYGHCFDMLKFRTMVDRPQDGHWEEVITEAGDWRVTRLGSILRRFRLDELPQIFNILGGHMSWIGPRPEAELLSRWYEAEIEGYAARHAVRPGISGWAQVNQGHVATLDEVRTKLAFDCHYIQHASLRLDLLIAVRTLKTIATGFGAK